MIKCAICFGRGDWNCPDSQVLEGFFSPTPCNIRKLYVRVVVEMPPLQHTVLHLCWFFKVICLLVFAAANHPTIANCFFSCLPNRVLQNAKYDWTFELRKKLLVFFTVLTTEHLPLSRSSLHPHCCFQSSQFSIHPASLLLLPASASSLHPHVRMGRPRFWFHPCVGSWCLSVCPAGLIPLAVILSLTHWYSLIQKVLLVTCAI